MTVIEDYERSGLVLATRQALNLSRKAFAERTGLTPTKITNIERNRQPTPEEWAVLQPFVESIFPVETDSQAQGAVSGAGSPTTTATPAPAPPPAPAPVNPPDAVQVPVFDLEASNSECQCFKRCRRKWWLAFYRRLGLKEVRVTGTRSVGNRIHEAMAGWYTPVNSRNPYEILEEGFTRDMEAYPDQSSELQQERALCVAMIEGFFEWLAETGVDQGYEIVGTEEIVSVPMYVNDKVILIKGRLDVRIRRTIDGAVLFRDWKTVGNLSEPIRTLHMDEQMLMYHLLEYLNLQQQGLENPPLTDGGLYTMMRRVKRTSTAKPPFYDQVEVRHNIHELQSFYSRLYGELLEIMGLRANLDAGYDPKVVAYPTPTKNCTWDCDFFPVCPMFDDGSNAEGMLEMLYADVDPYERYGDRKAED